MAFAGYNSIAIILAAVAGFMVGAVWYGALGRQWMAALGKTESDLRGEGGPSPIPFVISFVSLLVMAFVLAGIIGHLGQGQVTLRNGLISALLCWLGFVITTMATNHAFQRSRSALTLIDGLHWLLVLLVQGAVIGWMGV